MGDSIAWQTLSAVFSSWNDVKIAIERAGAVSNDAAHVIVGVLVHLVVAALLRRPLSAWLPWLAVLATLFINEAVDLWFERWPSLAMQVGEAIKDLLLTMVLPTALMAALRLWPNLGRASRH